MLFQGTGDIFEAELAKEPLRRAAHVVKSIVHSCLQRELRRQAAGGHNDLVLIQLRANAA
ncbi:MAG: hypothetical protein FRX49_04142 [Trebouxia sp. A1-2]|nr:MAG: hypothetical protein FRX49_04142 [Trebouxia sp. A1-2]